VIGTAAVVGVDERVRKAEDVPGALLHERLMPAMTEDATFVRPMRYLSQPVLNTHRLFAPTLRDVPPIAVTHGLDAGQSGVAAAALLGFSTGLVTVVTGGDVHTDAGGPRPEASCRSASSGIPARVPRRGYCG
jgi:hypothetical protein